jgi:hypothetical protein
MSHFILPECKYAAWRSNLIRSDNFILNMFCKFFDCLNKYIYTEIHAFLVRRVFLTKCNMCEVGDAYVCLS